MAIERTNNITDLSPLAGLRAVEGYFYIFDNAELRSLVGLENLEVAQMHITGNPQLANVDAVQALEKGGITFAGNRLETLPRFRWEQVGISLYDNGLKDLAGLRGVTRLQTLEVYEPALTDLQDLSALESADFLGLNGVPGPDLRALAKLRTVRGLSVGDNPGGHHGETPLVSLHGLEGLTTLESLSLRSDSLKSLAGLSGVVDVTKDLRISGAQLETLAGLDSLQHLTGKLELSGLPNGTNMPGLERLETAGGLSIGLRDAGLPALPALSRVTGHVKLHGTRDLRDLQNLGSLSHVGGDLIIDQNHALTDLRGLSKLQRIEGDLAIGFNDSLLSLDGLSPSVELQGRLLVLGNSSLPDTEADALAESTGRSCECSVYRFSPHLCGRCDAPCACVVRTP